MTIRQKIAYIILIALLTVSCSSIDCSIEGRVLCHFAFQDADGNNVQLKYPLTVTLHRTATDNDTVYINQLYNAATFDLPLSHVGELDEIELAIGINETTIVDDTIEVQETRYIRDKVRIAKTNAPVFESIDCTPRYNHVITELEHTNNFIESLIINKENVTKDASAPNIIIRLRGTAD